MMYCTDGKGRWDLLPKTQSFAAPVQSLLKLDFFSRYFRPNVVKNMHNCVLWSLCPQSSVVSCLQGQFSHASFLWNNLPAQFNSISPRGFEIQTFS